MPGSVPWLGCKGQGYVRQEGRQGGDGHHLSRVDGRESRWLCVKSGPGRSGMQGPSRGPGVKDSVALMVGGAGAAELRVPGGFLTGGGHQGRCRAILRPGAGSRVDTQMLEAALFIISSKNREYNIMLRRKEETTL